MLPPDSYLFFYREWDRETRTLLSSCISGAGDWTCCLCGHMQIPCSDNLSYLPTPSYLPLKRMRHRETRTLLSSGIKWCQSSNLGPQPGESCVPAEFSPQLSDNFLWEANICLHGRVNRLDIHFSWRSYVRTKSRTGCPHSCLKNVCFPLTCETKPWASVSLLVNPVLLGNWYGVGELLLFSSIIKCSKLQRKSISFVPVL